MEYNLLIIIPCYNEYNRLNIAQYSKDLENHTDISILFIDDGSKDNTVEKIQQLKALFPNQVFYLAKQKNEGKAAAIYDGMKNALKNYQHNYIAYIDADLAVSIDEIVTIKDITINENKNFGFGARWKRIGSKIERKLFRHIIGRIFATISSNLLDLDVYDTQCGAKVFKREIAEKIFDKPFNVNWSFDVEIFFRLLQIFPKKEFDKYCIEIPLKSWRDVDGSKVKFSDSMKVIKDFITLNNIYKK